MGKEYQPKASRPAKGEKHAQVQDFPPGFHPAKANAPVKPLVLPVKAPDQTLKGVLNPKVRVIQLKAKTPKQRSFS